MDSTPFALGRFYPFSLFKGFMPMDARAKIECTEIYDLLYPKQGISAKEQMIASGSGAIITSLFMTPLDVVKIRLQAQEKILAQQKCFLYCNGLTDTLCAYVNGNNGNGKGMPGVHTLECAWYKRPGKFNGSWDAFVKIARTEGITSLWSGLPPSLLMSIPTVVIYFTCYEQFKRRFSYEYILWDLKCSRTLRAPLTEKDRKVVEQKVQAVHDHVPHWIPFLCGGLARTWASSVVAPIELVRTKMQSVKMNYREIRSAVRHLVHTEGVRRLWMGLGPTLFRDVPFSSFYWTCLEALKKWAGYTHNPPPSFMFFAGATAGSIAAVLTLPFDVVKTHRQIELGQRMGKEISEADRRAMKTTLGWLKYLYQERGLSVLYTGIVPRLAKVAPACAIMIATYEFSKQFFANVRIMDEPGESLSGDEV
ncbi:unnamed protein product [Cyprideis torosa]|uniref:Uncharacterized protein n=1 Tax=Cyprideis torosa TaxID=163714 RepID=A0A7R8W4Q9_9CRUS|nr:unnamed protein product [Cyprideis torosa]CAG0880041.1 unnamed protein product [Cyprideis torosa]